MSTTIDAHLHIWDLSRMRYHWLTPDDTLLHRDVLPDEVYAHMQACGVDYALAVEAANLTVEIPYLLEQAALHPWLAGVIGWMSADDQWSGDAPVGLIGARLPWLQADGSVTMPDCVVRLGLSCDVILEPHAYEAGLALMRAHPQITFVIGHLAGVPLRPDPRHARDWEATLKPLAALPNAVMKVSGHLTSADPKPLSVDTLRRYLDVAARQFGVDRLMYGSNYPICLRAGSYAQDIDMVRQAIAHYSADEQAAIMGKTAVRVYRLTPGPRL
jgi:L-fuconolactonase